MIDLARLIFAGSPPQQVEVISLPQDTELAARNAERAKAAIAAMGKRWALHPANQPKRKEAA